MRLQLFYTLVAATAAIIQFPSCNSAGHLAREIAGTWTGNPEPLEMPRGEEATVTPVYTFVCDEAAAGGGGLVTLTAMVEAKSLTAIEGAPDAIGISASGVATLQGTWKAVKSNEIFVTFDARSISVSVDPTAVQLIPDASASVAVPAPETFKAGVAELLKQEIAKAVERRYLTSHRLTDVHISDGFVNWEVGDTTQILVRHND